MKILLGFINLHKTTDAKIYIAFNLKHNKSEKNIQMTVENKCIIK